MGTPNRRLEPTNFSLALGGPLYQLLRRVHLAGDSLELLGRRIVIFSLITWLPLLVLSAFEEQLLDDATAMPFLLDMEVHIRLLIALPLLIGAEVWMHQRLRIVVTQFQERQVIPESAWPRFETAIRSALWLRDSVLAEILLIAFVYGVGVFIIRRHYITLDTATWFAVLSGTGSRLSLAGMWYGYVSMPIFQFLLLRWYFRLFIWMRFLWQVSHIKLNLIPTHPDHAAGLGFLSQSAMAFVPLVMGHGVVLSGMIVNRIIYLGTTLVTYKTEIAAVAIFLQCIVLGPLLLFSIQLARARRRGLLEYGTLAERYVREFDAKWLRGGAPPNEPLVGNSDIQSLADLANSYEVIRKMRIAPVTIAAILQVAAATLLPIAPLLLTLVSLEDLAKMALRMVF